MTQVPIPATRSATTNAPKYQLEKCKATRAQLKTMSPSILHPANMPANHATSKSLFLLRDEDNSEIMTPSLLLPLNQDNPAITMATHTQNPLLYAQIGSAITTATHAQNLLLFFVRNNPANSKLHLIVAFIRRASTARWSYFSFGGRTSNHSSHHLQRIFQVDWYVSFWGRGIVFWGSTSSSNNFKWQTSRVRVDCWFYSNDLKSFAASSFEWSYCSSSSVESAR